MQAAVRNTEVTRTAETIVDALACVGWYVGASILPVALTARLALRARTLAEAGALVFARVGRGQGLQAHSGVRSDETRWLDAHPDDLDEQEALAHVNTLRCHLNESLFVGANGAELHFARYRAGALYRTHRDRFRNDDARLISLIFYLNEDWPRNAGGELVLYAADDSGREIARTAPTAGTMVCFLSERFPHEVLPATRERYSLTGWLRRDSEHRA